MPTGTLVQLLSARTKDKSTNGFVNWPLTSVATWGENPHGVWTVTVEDQVLIQINLKSNSVISVTH